MVCMVILCPIHRFQYCFGYVGFSFIICIRYQKIYKYSKYIVNIMCILESTVKTEFKKLDNWVTQNGWAGFDPYDIKGQDWFIHLFGKQTMLSAKIRAFLALLEMRSSPLVLRKLLESEKVLMPKAWVY